MKTVALCLSGHVRDFEKASSNLFDNILLANPNHKFHIFISTWNIVNSKNSEVVRRGIPHERLAYDNFNEIDCNKIVRTYNPLAMEVEFSRDAYFSKYLKYTGTPNNPLSVFSQFYKVKKVLKMILDYPKYDVVIRSRFDLKLSKKILLDDFDFNKNIIYIEDEGYPRNWASDKLAIMNFESSIYYSNFYDNLEEYMIKLKTTVPEMMLAEYLNSSNISFSKEMKRIGTLALF